MAVLDARTKLEFPRFSGQVRTEEP